MKHINTYNNFLNEGINDNYLYHSVNIRNFIRIMETDTLKVGRSNFISLTRNKNFWFNNIQQNSIRLVLDKNKLSHNYKIIPYDFFNKSSKFKNMSKSDTSRSIHMPFEYEEIVNKDILNLGEYIHSIEFTELALGLNIDYKPFNFDQLDILKTDLKKYLIKYPNIKLHIIDIDNKYLNGGLISIRNMIMIKKFNEFSLNESFRDNEKGMSLDDMMNKKSSYKDNVASCLITIITNERGISEKSFKQYDEVIEEVEDFYEENKNDLDNIINEFEQNNWRKSYCAEKIYCDYFSDSLNEAKKKKTKKSFQNVNKPEDLKNIMDGVSLGKDKNGYFVYTHRARSKSYKNVHDIPKSKIKFIETTG